MCGECPLHGSCRMIKVTMGELRNLVMFHQVDSEELYDKGLEIIETNLQA